METVNDILNNFTNFFNSNNVPFVIGGGYGVKMLCDIYSICVDIDVNNLDIFYLSNTPITTSYISSYRRTTDPRTTTVYTTEAGFNINLTMIRSNYINFIQYDNMKIMHPKKLITYYNDEFDMNETMRFKYLILDSIIENINIGPVYCVTKFNQIEIENKQRTTYNTTPLARRLCVIQEQITE